MLPASLLPTIDIPQHLYAAPYTIRTMRTYKTLLIWCCPSVAIERHTTRLQPSWLKTMDCFELCNRLWVAVVAFIRRFLQCPSHVLRKSARLRTSASSLPTPAMDEDGEAHLTWALDRYQRTLRSNERSRAIDLFLFDRNRLEVEPGPNGVDFEVVEFTNVSPCHERNRSRQPSYLPRSICQNDVAPVAMLSAVTAPAASNCSAVKQNTPFLFRGFC